MTLDAKRNLATGRDVPKYSALDALIEELRELEEIDLDAASDDDPIGTKKVGYAKPDQGPFLCINCVHSDREGVRCNHPEVVADDEVEKDGDLAIIEPAACCNEFRPRNK